MSAFQVARTGGEKGAPVIFTFHGTGGDETQFHGLASDLMPRAHVVSPRGNVSERGMNRFFRRTGEGVYDMPDFWARAEEMARFLAKEKEASTAGRAIGLGYSNGANILAAVAMTRPEIVDDLILMHPLIPFAPEPQPGLRGRSVLITAGRNDPICPAPLTQNLVAYFEAQAAEVTVEWHDGGHEVRQSELAAVQAFLK